MRGILRAMKPTRVPHESLSAEALQGLIKAFVTRDGTDYGLAERSLEDRKAAVYRQLKGGDVHVVFDPETETATILLSRDLPSPSETSSA